MKTKDVQAVFRLRLYPTEEQELLLKQFCGAARWVYNWGLARWKERQAEGLNTTAYELMIELALMKYCEPTKWLQDIQAAGLQQSLSHLGLAFSNFFKKTSNTPQFKKRGDRDSFSFPQNVTIDSVKSQITLPIIKSVTYRGSFKEGSVIKTVTVVREGDGWYACIRTMKTVTEHTADKRIVGIDVGVATLATVHNGSKALQFHHHAGLDKMIKRISILNEQMSRKRRVDKVNSKNREKARAKLAKAYARLTNMRKDCLHKLSRSLVRHNGTIIVEDLKIKNMTKSASGTLESPGTNVAQKRGLNRVITKQAWGMFFNMLEYKCNWYGRTFIKVDAKNTSRTCPSCNHIAKENRESQAVFHCVACGHQDNADSVGALNVLRRGLATQLSS